MRGFVRMNPGLMFRSCDMQVSAPIRDSTGSDLMAAYQTLRPAGEGLYVIASGSLSPEQDVVLRSVEFAGLPGPRDGCDQPTLDYVVGVVGLDSDWRVLARDASFEFLPDSGETLYFPPASPTDSAGVVRYRSVGDGHELEVLLTRVNCLAKGVSTARQAEVTLDGRVMNGCAWRTRP
jgi:uncharacterized membrane protein